MITVPGPAQHWACCVYTASLSGPVKAVVVTQGLVSSSSSSWVSLGGRVLAEALRACAGRCQAGGAAAKVGFQEGTVLASAGSPLPCTVPTLKQAAPTLKQAATPGAGLLPRVRDSCVSVPPPRREEQARPLCGCGRTPVSRTCV